MFFEEGQKSDGIPSVQLKATKIENSILVKGVPLSVYCRITTQFKRFSCLALPD